jgi:hypothetical protein
VIARLAYHTGISPVDLLNSPDVVLDELVSIFDAEIERVQKERRDQETQRRLQEARAAARPVA